MYTVTEFCELFKVTKTTFYNWVNQDKIKILKLGKVTRITEEEVERIKREGL